MIIETPETNKGLFVVDVGRPTFYTVEAREEAKKFQTWIKECDIEIVVNGAFWTIEQMIAEESFYGGGGFKYQFCLKSEEDVQKFKERWPNAVEPHKMTYIPEDNVSYIYDVANSNKFRFWEERGSKRYNDLTVLMNKKLEDRSWKIVPLISENGGL